MHGFSLPHFGFLLVVACGGRLLWHDNVEGVVGNRKILWGLCYDLPVYVYGQVRVRLEPDPGSSEVVYAVCFDEISALEVPGSPYEVPMPAQVYGIDVEDLIIYA